jgi:hypothetical protein
MKLPVVFRLSVILAIAQANSVVYAQSGNWRVYSPPDRSFSVESPAPLSRVASFDGEHGAILAADQEQVGLVCYAVIQPNQEESRFGVVVVDGRNRGIRSLPRERLISYLSVMRIGDDDDPEPESERAIYANGLRGREYFFVRENRVFSNGSTGEIFTRGRIFDVGNKIYIVVFRGETAADLRSADAERFLNSFRLLRRDRRR